MNKTMIKKVVMGLLVVTMAGTVFVGCGSDDAEETATVEEQEENEKVEVEEPEEEEEEEEDIEVGDTFAVGDFEVKVNSVQTATDWEDQESIVVNVDWTNNSEETTSWEMAMSSQAFQDGMELESSFLSGDDDEQRYRDIRPDNTLEDIELVFNVEGTSDVELEISEWLSFEEAEEKVIIEFPE